MFKIIKALKKILKAKNIRLKNLIKSWKKINYDLYY